MEYLPHCPGGHCPLPPLFCSIRLALGSLLPPGKFLKPFHDCQQARFCCPVLFVEPASSLFRVLFVLRRCFALGRRPSFLFTTALLLTMALFLPELLLFPTLLSLVAHLLLHTDALLLTTALFLVESPCPRLMAFFFEMHVSILVCPVLFLEPAPGILPAPAFVRLAPFHNLQSFFFPLIFYGSLPQLCLPFDPVPPLLPSVRHLPPWLLLRSCNLFLLRFRDL